MAGQGKKSGVKKAASETKVTRITATDTKKVSSKNTATPKAEKTAPKSSPAGRLATPFIAIARYFKGAWYELRQVRWPNRKATWSLTAAMLVFTGFFVVLILLLDALFKYLFELILG